MSRQLAVEFGPQGLRVNAICPGVVQTPPVESMLADQAVRQSFLAKIPLRRLGQPEDVALAAIFLASGESSFVTGTTLVVDGGESAGRPPPWSFGGLRTSPLQPGSPIRG